MKFVSFEHVVTNEEHSNKPFAELSYFLANRIEKITGVVAVTPELIMGLMQEHAQYVESQQMELVYRPMHAGEHNTGVY